MNNIVFLIQLAISFVPFLLFVFFNGKSNTKKEVRQRQYLMPVIAVVYCIVIYVLNNKLVSLLEKLIHKLVAFLGKTPLDFIGNFIDKLYNSWGMFLMLVLFNTATLVAYVILKRILTLIFGKIRVPQDSFISSVVQIFYIYDDEEDAWFIKDNYKQARFFVKVVYYAGCLISGVIMLVSCSLCLDELISEPFYPVFPVIILGEIAFFIDGIGPEEQRSSLSVRIDNSKRIAMYPLLRKPLRAIFGDKLSNDGTTVNNGGSVGGAIEDVLSSLETEGGHIGKNYTAYIRKKMALGLKPDVDYVRSGYELSVGKSLLFNTPFYDKLNPFVFYAMNREMLRGGKVLIVLGRHGTESDLMQWAQKGMQEVSNIPDMWNISVLSGEIVADDNTPDIGIISRSGVHDLDIHKCNLSFLSKVSFVVLVEPSKLVTTAQIGLNLLIKCCGKDKSITFCSVDRNCDGLVDALSHILMTNITEVSATEYPHGMSSYMYWTADDDYLQHRILPGISRCLGMGVELSMVALKNQVRQTMWYGGEVFPVIDAHWIAKQYYYDLLEYAQLPTTQETFDKCFGTSFNMCNERVSDYSFITVEDDRNNLFETRRIFATIAEEQGFVNVISSDYMLREYMAENLSLFSVDAKAIPYITADYARSKRNAILSLCLLLCINCVPVETLNRQMVMLNINTNDPVSEIWNELCLIFNHGTDAEVDEKGCPILCGVAKDGSAFRFEKNRTILYKREYSVESGKFESVYTIDSSEFSRVILDDLQNASYIAEQENKDVYIGTELKGHVYQKYMPGQFFTLNGKYYEMVSTSIDNRILVRRASEHIGGRFAYRQIRKYRINHLENSDSMGALKTVNDIDIHYQFADLSVETPGYWKLRAHNDFDNGDLVTVNGVPSREYHHKQILKFDFSKLGDAFTDSIRMTLTALLNETFVTLFADNQPFISAVTPGEYEAPITYSLELGEAVEASEKCIFIIEDSQLDIGLLIAVERNIGRIFNIISDYLGWNGEMIEQSLPKEEVEEEVVEEVVEEEEPVPEKKGIFKRIGGWFKGLFGKKSKQTDVAQDYMMIYGKPHKLVKGKWVACSQEEFDERMNHRHELIDKQKEEQQQEQEQEQEQEALTQRQRRKAEKAAAKAAKRAAKEEKKAAKRAAKEEKKAAKTQTEEEVNQDE